MDKNNINCEALRDTSPTCFERIFEIQIIELWEDEEDEERGGGGGGRGGKTTITTTTTNKDDGGRIAHSKTIRSQRILRILTPRALKHLICRHWGT